MKILFLTHYYPPEIGAPQARIPELAKRLQSFGHDVMVLTCFPNYPSGDVPERYKGMWKMREVLNGVDVCRTYVFATPNTGFLLRILNHLSFTLSSLFAIPWIGKRDIIITECPPLFLGVAGIIIAKCKRAKHVFNVADLWPESAIEMDALRNRFIIYLSQRLASSIYNHSDLITVTAKGQRERLIQRGIDAKKIADVPNGVDTTFFRVLDTPNGFRKDHGLDDKFVVFYGGTMGLAQGLSVLVEAARILSSQSDIIFLFVGDGVEKKKLKELAADYRLSNTMFLDVQARTKMPEIVNAIDVGVISLRSLDVFRGVLPSKMFEYMACGKPVIACAEGNASEIVSEAECGIVVEPESAEGLADAVVKLRAKKQRLQELGANGRDFVSKYYSRDAIAKSLEQALISIVR